MARVYTVSMNAVAVSALQDLFTILCPSTMAVEIHSIILGQKSLVSWEAKEIRVLRVPATVTITGGTAVTPRPMLQNDAASLLTGCTINNTTVATSSGTIVDLINDDWNFLNGWQWMPAGYDDRLIIAPSQAMCVRLPTAPSASMTVSGSVTFAEIF